jgi:hypothetical protein
MVMAIVAVLSLRSSGEGEEGKESSVGGSLISLRFSLQF